MSKSLWRTTWGSVRETAAAWHALWRERGALAKRLEAARRDLEIAQYEIVMLQQERSLSANAAQQWMHRCQDLEARAALDRSESLGAGEIERLAVLAEVCGASVRAAGWVLRGGWDGPAPFGTLNCRAALERELGNVRTAINLLHDAGDVRGADMSTWQRKYRKILAETMVKQRLDV